MLLMKSDLAGGADVVEHGFSGAARLASRSAAGAIVSIAGVSI